MLCPTLDEFCDRAFDLYNGRLFTMPSGCGCRAGCEPLARNLSGSLPGMVAPKQKLQAAARAMDTRLAVAYDLSKACEGMTRREYDGIIRRRNSEAHGVSPSGVRSIARSSVHFAEIELNAI